MGFAEILQVRGRVIFGIVSDEREARAGSDVCSIQLCLQLGHSLCDERAFALVFAPRVDERESDGRAAQVRERDWSPMLVLKRRRRDGGFALCGREPFGGVSALRKSMGVVYHVGDAVGAFRGGGLASDIIRALTAAERETE